MEVAQTLTPCRFAAVPLGKGHNESHFQQALCRARARGAIAGFSGTINPIFNKLSPLPRGTAAKRQGVRV